MIEDVKPAKLTGAAIDGILFVASVDNFIGTFLYSHYFFYEPVQNQLIEVMS